MISALTSKNEPLLQPKTGFLSEFKMLGGVPLLIRVNCDQPKITIEQDFRDSEITLPLSS